MNISFRAGARAKSRSKSLKEAFATGRRPVYVCCGRKSHEVPETVILRWTDGKMSVSSFYRDGVLQARVPKPQPEVAILRLQPEYAELRDARHKRVQWKEGRIK